MKLKAKHLQAASLAMLGAFTYCMARELSLQACAGFGIAAFVLLAASDARGDTK